MGPLHPALVPSAQLASNPLDPWISHLFSFLFTSGYVGSIYISNHIHSRTTAKTSSARPGPGAKRPADASLRPTPDPVLDELASKDSYVRDDSDKPKPGERNHPDTIRRRMKAVGVATVLSVGGVWWIVKVLGGYGGVEAVSPTLTLLGLAPPPTLNIPSLRTVARAALPYALAPILLLGPLYATYLDGDVPTLSYSSRHGLELRWDRFSAKGTGGWGLAEWRNYVVGPLTEEIVFRSCLLSVALLSRSSMRTMVFVTPVYFGIAHAHHAWEIYTKGGRTTSSAIQAIAGSVFQLTYTTLFGWFATYSYLRTASVLPALASHTFCNIMGIYLPHMAAARHPRQKGTIWGLYGVGIVSFILGLRGL